MNIRQSQTENMMNPVVRWFVGAHPSIDDPRKRHEARLYSSLLLALLMLVGVRILVGYITGSAATDTSFVYLWVIIGAIALAYFISRTQRYLWGLLLALSSLSLLILMILVTRGDYSQYRIVSSSIWLLLR